LYWYKRLCEKPDFIPIGNTQVRKIPKKKKPKEVEVEIPLLDFPSTPSDELIPSTRDDENNNNNKGDSGGNTKVPAQLY
jgi:hypothetical protein